jgi:serine/threonine protein kinase
LDAPTLTQVGDEEWYWMAPEVLMGSTPKDLENDIWAFACTYYKVRLSHLLIPSAIKMMAKVLTGNAPFADLYPSATFMLKAFSDVGSQNKDSDFRMVPKLGRKFKIESNLKDGWDSEEMKKCWTWDHTKRITADALFKSFNKGNSKARPAKQPAKPSPISRQETKSDVNLDHVDAILKRVSQFLRIMWIVTCDI